MTDPNDSPEDSPEQPDAEGGRRDVNGVLRDSRGRIVKGSPYNPNSGRKTGISPHSRFNWDVKKICEEYGYNPVEGLIHTATTTQNQTLKFKCDSELLKYCAPTLRSSEIKTEQTNRIVFTWADDASQIPTINEDGTPVMSHRPEVVFDPGTVIEEVEAALHKDDKATPSG